MYCFVCTSYEVNDKRGKGQSIKHLTFTRTRDPNVTSSIGEQPIDASN